MRVIISSNGPHVGSGYGVPVKSILPYLANAGHEVAVQAWYGVNGGSVNYGNVVLYPSQGHTYGVDVIGAQAKHFGADLVVTLMDNWCLPLDYGQRFDARWLSWFPVDGVPVPQASVDRARACDYPAVFSRDGVELLAKAGVKVDYLPYAVDCDVFKPGDKERARKQLNFPQDRFLIVTVGANKGYPARKAWPELLMAYKKFQTSHEDALLYLHTRMTPISKEGIKFAALLSDLEIPKESLAVVPQDQLAVGVPNDDLPVLYQAADVMLLPSMGEGFGLPIAEAQACGCPVITQACSAMTELTINGIAIEAGQPLWVPGLNYWWRVPVVERIVEALEAIYTWPTFRRLDMAMSGIGHFRAHYHWPTVFEQYWIPLLDRIESEMW